MKKKKKPGKKGNDGSALLNVLLTAEGRAPKAEGKKEIGGAARQSQRTALMFRKVRLRDDAAPWWGLSKWDESWVRDLKSFQLPKPEMDLSALGGGAFKKKSFVKNDGATPVVPNFDEHDLKEERMNQKVGATRVALPV